MPGAFRRIARSPAAPIVTLGALLCLSTIALFLTDLQTRYRDRIAAAKTDAQSFANILAEHTALSFEEVDRVLLEAESVRKNSLAGKYPNQRATNAALQHLQKGSSILVAVGWTDASGNVVAHSYDRPLPRSNIADMAHFITPRDSNSDELFISPPYRSAVSDKWFMAASRRLSNADGSFAGIVTAPIDQASFTQLYRSINMGSHGSVLLLHRNGQLLAREPLLEAAIGRSYAKAPLLAEHLPKSESGSYETRSAVDDVPRIAGYHAVRGLPLVILVSFGRSDVLAPWYRHLYTFGLLVFSITVVILIGTLVLMRQTNSLAAKTRALARTNTRFDIAISNMTQGLCLFDVDKRLVISNRRYQEMYRLPDQLVLPGTPLDRILQHYADRGETSDLTVDQHVRLMPTTPRQDYQPSDGRQIFIQRKPLPEGGWVATHEDVTEQKRAEHLLAEKATELAAMNERFDAALNNMSQGLCMFDVEQKVVVSNARYSEIYHLSRDQICPGTSLAQILEYRREKGTAFADITPETYLARNVREAKEVRELADGRVIAIARHMMANGGWLTTHEDITDRARNEKRIAFLAQHDLLTGLANRTLFSEKLDDAAKRLKRHGSNFTVLMLDLDKFKNVNDTLGHPAGDQLLVEVARRLQSSLRDTDVVARLGGDEFAIIQENEKNQGDGAMAGPQDHRLDRAALRPRRPQSQRWNQHRNCIRPRTRQRCRNAAAEGGHRALRREVGRPERFPPVQVRTDRSRGQAEIDGRRIARGDFRPRVRTAISAGDRCQNRRGKRRGGVRALASPFERLASARPVPAAGGVGRLDAAARRMDPAAGVPGWCGVAFEHPDCRQPRGKPVRQRQFVRHRFRRAGRVRAVAGPAGTRNNRRGVAGAGSESARHPAAEKPWRLDRAR